MTNVRGEHPSVGADAMVDQADGRPPRTDSLLWRLDTAAGSHRLEIQPSLMRNLVTLVVDGRTVGLTRKPTMRDRWSASTFDVDGVEFMVVLSPGPLVMSADVFRDGISIVDGRSIDEARATSPRATSRYEHWTHVNITGVSSSAVAPPWVVVVTVGAIAMIVVALTFLQSGIVASMLVGAGGLLLLLLFVRLWLVATAKTHGYLLARQDIGDWTRLAMIAAVFIAVPIGGVVAVIAVLALAGAL